MNQSAASVSFRLMVSLNWWNTVPLRTSVYRSVSFHWSVRLDVQGWKWRWWWSLTLSHLYLDKRLRWVDVCLLLLKCNFSTVPICILSPDRVLPLFEVGLFMIPPLHSVLFQSGPSSAHSRCWIIISFAFVAASILSSSEFCCPCICFVSNN